MFITSGKETYKAGEIVFKEGSHGAAVYVLSSGSVEISKMIQGRKVVVEILGPGDIFGEMSYIDHASRSATAIALENTVLELVDKDFLDREFNQIASDFRQIISTLVRRLRKTTQNLLYSPRREEERARTRTKIRISFKKASDFFRAYIGNLSGGGLFIKTTKSLPVGTLSDLEFTLPDSNQVIRTTGEVAWIRSKDESSENKPTGMGIQFIDMNPENKKLLQDYIASVKSS